MRGRAWTAVYSACWRLLSLCYLSPLFAPKWRNMITAMIEQRWPEPAEHTHLAFDQCGLDCQLPGLCILFTKKTVWGNGAATECWQSFASIPSLPPEWKSSIIGLLGGNSTVFKPRLLLSGEHGSAAGNIEARTTLQPSSFEETWARRRGSCVPPNWCVVIYLCTNDVTSFEALLQFSCSGAADATAGCLAWEVKRSMVEQLGCCTSRRQSGLEMYTSTKIHASCLQPALPAPRSPHFLLGNCPVGDQYSDIQSDTQHLSLPEETTAAEIPCGWITLQIHNVHTYTHSLQSCVLTEADVTQVTSLPLSLPTID